MATRDLLLLFGFLRGGKLYPSAVPYRELPSHRSLKIVYEGMAEQELVLFGRQNRPTDRDDLKRRAAVASWSGQTLPVGSRIGEVPDPGVLLCLLYEGPVAEAALPVDVFAQTLRRYALRDQVLRGKFDEHVDRAGTFVPAWFSPELRKQKSQEAFDTAMRAAREHGFAHAAPLFEGVRGECYAQAQIAIAVYELRELGDNQAALRRLNEIVKVAPRNVAARMQRAKILAKEAGRQVEASADYLAILRELARADTAEPSRELREAAMQGCWALHREYSNPRKLEAALTAAQQDPERGLDALSRYVDTHPCAWDAQTHLATLALTLQRFDLTAKLLSTVRWLFPEDPNPHFIYGQALASKTHYEPAVRALERAAVLAPDDADIQRWLAFARRKLEQERQGTQRTPSIDVARQVARSLLVLLGIVRDGRVYPVALVLRNLPGDVSLALILQSIAAQERKRFGGGIGQLEDADLARVGERSRLTDWAGEELHVDQTVGDVPDPGIIVALLYDAVRDDVGRPAFDIPPETCRSTLLTAVQQDSELAAKLDRHLKSPEASLKSRLEL